MNNIAVNKILNSLSEESFTKFKGFTEKYFSYYFNNSDRASREVVLEKYGEYLRLFEMRIKVRDEDFANIYTNYLTKYVDNRISDNNSRVNEYYARLKEINTYKDKSEDDLNDFTRIFLGLYSKCNEEKDIEDIDLDITNIECIKEIEKLQTDKPTMKSLEDEKAFNKIPKKVLKRADDVRRVAVDLNKGIQDLGNDLGKALIRKKKEDNPTEIIHDHIERAKETDIHSKENFTYILMYLLYLQAVDFEKGHGV